MRRLLTVLTTLCLASTAQANPYSPDVMEELRVQTELLVFLNSHTCEAADYCDEFSSAVPNGFNTLWTWRPPDNCPPPGRDPLAYSVCILNWLEYLCAGLDTWREMKCNDDPEADAWWIVYSATIISDFIFCSDQSCVSNS